jgi:predicted class III extradiol MEMO1 family dioxygenase
VFIFSPRCSKPVYLQKGVVPENRSILCAAFVPHFGLAKTSEVVWQEHSQLYFLDTDQVVTIGVCFMSLKIQLVWVYTVQSSIKKILK